MDEEPVLIKKEKTEEVVNEVKEEVKQEEEELFIEKEGIFKKIVRIFLRVVFILIVLFVIIDTVIGVLSMQRLNDNKEPIWYIDSKTETVDGKTKTTYNLGLYVIIKEKGGKESKTTLTPFFLK